MRKAVKILCFIVIFTVAFLLQLVNSTAHSISANEAVALGWQSPVSGKIEVLKEFEAGKEMECRAPRGRFSKR